MKPIVHLYALCWNEEKIIPYFMQHYQDVVDRFFIYDNESTDNSFNLLSAYNNVEIITYKSDNTIRDDFYLAIKNNEWKKSRGIADYVIVCDMDEFIYYDNLIGWFEMMKNNNYSITSVVGYDMIAEEFNYNYEQKLIEQLGVGAQNYFYNKLIVFDPNKINEINYIPGAHLAYPTGEVLYSPFPIKLLHYKYLGLNNTLDRLDLYKIRLSGYNKEKGFGIEYELERESHIQRFYNILRKSQQVI